MTLKKWLHDTRVIFTALQALAILLMIAGTALMLTLDWVGVSLIFRYIHEGHSEHIPFAILCLLGVKGVSALCYVAIITFIRMCGRLKTGTAFTPENTLAMRRIALCGLSVGLLLFIIDGLIHIISILLFGDPAMHLVDVQLMGLGFLFLAVALVAWTLYLLLERAVALQEENDLTI